MRSILEDYSGQRREATLRRQRLRAGLEHNGKLYWNVLRDYPKQVESLLKTKKRARRHAGISIRDTKTLPHRCNTSYFTAQNKCCSASKWMRGVRPERTFRQVDVQDSWYCWRRAPNTAIESLFISSTKHGSRREQLTRSSNLH